MTLAVVEHDAQWWRQKGMPDPGKSESLTDTGLEPVTFCSEDRCSTIEPADRSYYNTPKNIYIHQNINTITILSQHSLRHIAPNTPPSTRRRIIYCYDKTRLATPLAIDNEPAIKITKYTSSLAYPNIPPDTYK